jgi:hypothetical protein
MAAFVLESDNMFSFENMRKALLELDESAFEFGAFQDALNEIEESYFPEPASPIANADTDIAEKVDFSDILSMSREELDGLTLIHSEFRSSSPIKITYDNICVYEFSTEMNANPRIVFGAVVDFAHPIIDHAVRALDANIVEKRGDDWIVHNSFISMSICLHCETVYDQGDYVFEDTATHRVLVSIVAEFDTKFIYQSDEHNADIFGKVNQFYSKLAQSLTDM